MSMGLTKYDGGRVNAPVRDASRARVDLSGTWDFRYDGDADRDEGRHGNTTLPERILVPGPLQLQPDAFGADRSTPSAPLSADRRGHSWYGKRLHVPDDWQDRRVLLKFGGVMPEARVYVDGTFVGAHDLPQASFAFDITPLARPGSEIHIRVHLLENDRIRTGGLGRAPWSGLWRTVELESVGPVFLTDVFCLPVPERKGVRVFAEISQPEGCEIDVAIGEVGGGTVGAGRGSLTPEGVFVPLSRWTPWRPEHPQLYAARVQLKRNGRLLDADTVRFGLKYFATRGNRILLGGEDVFFVGYCVEGSDWNTLSPATDREAIRAAMGELVAKGFNHARHHTHFPSDEYLDVADELGVMVSGEVSHVSNLHVIRDPGHAFDLWTRVIRQTRNHPSMAVYSMGNEGSGVIRRAQAGFIRRARRAISQMAPNALCVKTTGAGGESAGESDFETPPIGGNVSFMDACRGFVTADWSTYEGLLARSPAILHEWGKVSALARIQAKPEPQSMRRFPKPFLSAYELAEQKGLLPALPKWSDASEGVFSACLKLNLEVPRLLQHWRGWQVYLRHASLHGSLRDAFPFPDMIRCIPAEEMLRTTGPLAVLHDRGYRGRCLRPGSEERVTLYASNGSSREIADACCAWRLVVADGNILAEGEQSIGAIAPAGRTRLCHVDLLVPPANRAEACKLEARIEKAGTMLATNAWNYWIFPEPDIGTHGRKFAAIGHGRDLVAVCRAANGAMLPWPDCIEDEKPDVIAVAGLDNAIIDFIVSGGRAILVGRAFDELRVRDIKVDVDRASFYVPYRSGWDDGNLGTLVRDHPALGDFPHEGFGDLQFFDLIDGAYPQELERWPVPIDPIVRAIPPLQRPANRGYLFEFRCGRGRVVASTLRNDDTPAWVYLLGRLVDYASSDAFEPDVAVPEEFLRGLVDPYYSGLPHVPEDIVNLNEGPGKPVAAEPVDLSGIAESPFTDAAVHPGMRQVLGVPFRIGERCFAARSMDDPLAPWSVDVAVGRFVTAVHLLWMVKDFTPRPVAADYACLKVRLASGLSPTMPLRHSPKGRGAGLTQEELAGMLPPGGGRAIHAATWRNPTPADRVEKVSFSTEGRQGRVFLLALSVSVLNGEGTEQP